MNTTRYAFALACLLLFSLPAFAGIPDKVTNHDVVAMASHGLDDTVVANKIRTTESVAFDVSPEALAQMKKLGVGTLSINAIIERQASLSKNERKEKLLSFVSWGLWASVFVMLPAALYQNRLIFGLAAGAGTISIFAYLFILLFEVPWEVLSLGL